MAGDLYSSVKPGAGQGTQAAYLAAPALEEIDAGNLKHRNISKVSFPPCQKV